MGDTNFKKLVRWDADFYKSLTDNDCILCLTEREVYLIGQILDALRWSRTRWIGDIIGLDFDLIASNLEYRLAERVTCSNLTQLLEKLTQLETKIDTIFNDTVIDNGGDLTTQDTTIADIYSDEAMDSDFSYTPDVCDDDGKSALYSGIREFVNYVHANNIDSLQQISQAGSNVAQQASRLISGVPGVGLLPFDEAASYAGFLIDELLEEYEATVDEELLQTTICDLFCIAVNSNCSFKYRDAIDYFSSKIPSTPLSYASTIADIANFAATGTFTGDDYFYFMCIFQFIAVAISDHYFGTHGINDYLLRVASGENSPDADWMILCVECPIQYRIWEWDFTTQGAGDWYLDPAVDPTPPGELISGEGWRGTPDPAAPRVRIARAIDPTWEIWAIGFNLDWTFDTTGGSRSLCLRPTAGSTTGQVCGVGTGTLDYNQCRDIAISPTDGMNELAIDAFTGAGGYVAVERVAIIFTSENYKVGSKITEDKTICV